MNFDVCASFEDMREIKNIWSLPALKFSSYCLDTRLELAPFTTHQDAKPFIHFIV